MKHNFKHNSFKHNWFLNPLVGVARTKIVKNELGEDEQVFVSGVERRDKTNVSNSHVDFIPYIQVRSMLTGNGYTTRSIVMEALHTYGIHSKKKNVALNFEQSLRLALPILGTKTISRTHAGNSADVAVFREKQAVSLLTNWLVSAVRTSTKNLPKKSGKAMGTEVHTTGLLKSSSLLLKKRAAFYNDLWSLYNMKDDDDSKKQ